MAKSIRSKREKRLRAIRREMVQPIYDQKEAAKLAAQEAALAAPKLPVKTSSSASTSAMDFTPAAAGPSTSLATDIGMDVEMGDGSKRLKSLKAIGKKLKKKIKLSKKKHHGKGKIRRKNI